MFRSALLITFFGLIVSGCASDGKIETSGGDKSSMSSEEVTVSSPSTSGGEAAKSRSMNQSNSSNSRIAAGVEEETLDTCLARIPKDATAGQRMLAEQTCRRDYAGRR
jgi:hypothetical protein